MLKRIVKMTFLPEEAATFEGIFMEKKTLIRAFPGCHHLELVRDYSGNIFFTISLWESEKELANYRHSELFAATWKKVKPLFAEKAEAWSTNVIATLP